ncbi:hypothetical protein [Alteribacillus sp. HJP-4]|uniref:hypothetical protein n=1 Tax=Alteribacillus sp. HJP-4 TaxID=2775394 RepID=UPI0035CD0F62
MKLFIIISLLSTMVILSAAAFYVSRVITDPKEENADAAIEKFHASYNESAAEVEAVLEDTIKKAHTDLNDITGYGNHTNYKSGSVNKENLAENWAEIDSELASHADFARDAAGMVEDKTLSNDLKNFSDVTLFAKDNRDHKALLYSHRIIHDLDTIYNGVEKSIFGAVHIGSGDDDKKKHLEAVEVLAEASSE